MNAKEVHRVLERAGIRYVLIGATAVALRGHSRSTQVDVVVGKWKWEQQVVERSERMNAFGESVPVATSSDLILLKLAAGGYKDLVDAASLLSLGPRESIVAEISTRIADLPAEAQVEWAKMLDATP